MATLLTQDRDLLSGTVVDRPNRFVVRVDFGAGPERAFLGDPGALEGLVVPGREILCSAVDDRDRATDFDAVAAVSGDTYVSLRPRWRTTCSSGPCRSARSIRSRDTRSTGESHRSPNTVGRTSA